MGNVVNKCVEFSIIENGRTLIVHGFVLDYCYINLLLSKVVLGVHFDIHNSDAFTEMVFESPYIPECFKNDITFKTSSGEIRTETLTGEIKLFSL